MSENKPSILQTWIIAIRPFAYTASVAAVGLGLALAIYQGFAINWIHFLLCLFGVIFFHTAANLLGDVFDFDHQLDTQVFPTSGAVVRGLLSKQQVFRAAVLCLVLGIALGIYFIFTIGWPILWLGLPGGLIALVYTGPKFGLKYRRLGDLVIFISFGLLPVLGTFYVQTNRFDLMPWLWFIPIGLITVAILHANNWRDIENDARHDCFTLAQSLGQRGSRIYYYGLIIGPYLLTLLYVLLGLINPALAVSPFVLLVFLSFPLVIKLIKSSHDPKSFVMLDGFTAQLQLAFSLLLITGFVIAGLIR